MVLLHIVTEQEKQAYEIVDFLTNEKLIIEAVIQGVTVRKKVETGQSFNLNQYLIMAKTKALLFNRINLLLKQKYIEHMPVLYSLPVLNMEFEQANQLSVKLIDGEGK